MRQIVLDTETTGLDPREGHRIIEIGGVELVDRRLTGKTFHQYLQPDRSIESEAVEVHGITDDFLADKPRFSEIGEAFLAFIEGAELVIHNAAFDLGFLDAELARWRPEGPSVESLCTVTDTLILARGMHPGQRNSLDALCKRYAVSNEHRELHGALLDAEILAEVYLAMTGGQVALHLVNQDPAPSAARSALGGPSRLDPNRPRLRVVHASESECAAHAARLKAIDSAAPGGCLWLRLAASDPGVAPGAG